MSQLSDDDRLERIEASLARLELELAARVPIDDIRRAMEDIFETYGLVSQLREVYTTQRDELAALVILATHMLEEEREHDAIGIEQRAAISLLLIQLQELGRKHVTGLYDLERAISWRKGDAERRMTG